MEKMEQSLHNYLEHAEHPVPIHAQLDICHDIMQGLEYIHSREYIHGDITATNILLQGRRAKIGGMMTLQCKSPDAELSLCPGTPAYLPMRSFSFPDYDESIDCFSFGVLALHIATGRVPSPTSHVTEPSSEFERYRKSIVKVGTRHLMYPTIIQCLKDQSMRPTAATLCKQLSTLKEEEAYQSSLKSADAGEEIERVKHQAMAEKEEMKANFQKETEEVRNEAKRDLQKATEEKNKLEQDLKHEIHLLTTACEKAEKEREEWKTKSEEQSHKLSTIMEEKDKLKKEREEWKTKSEKGEKLLKEQSHKLSAIIEEHDKLQHDIQERSDNLGRKLRDLQSEISN